MKKESMVGRRLYAWIIDVFVLFILIFMFDGLVSLPIFESVTDINVVQASYIEHSEEYNLIQEEYNIYYYDDNGERIYNEDVTEETKQLFLNDSRILELNEKLIKEQEYILINFILRIMLSIFLAHFISKFILGLLIGKGRSFGKYTAKICLVDDNYNYAKWYIHGLRCFLDLIFNVYLAILSLGMVPLINLLITINQKDNKSICDLICKTQIVDCKIPVGIKYKK